MGTPLHVAAETGHAEEVAILLQKGEDNKDALDGPHGDTPLILASKAGHLSVVKTLLAADADFRIRVSGNTGDSIRNVVTSMSALDLAAQGGHVPVLQAILDHGADVNERNHAGYCALHFAAQADEAGAVEALIEAGANIEAQDPEFFHHTPLLRAAEGNSPNAILALLRRGARIDVRAGDGETALHLACYDKRGDRLEATVDVLLRWGADETALNDLDHCPGGPTPADRLKEWEDFDLDECVWYATDDEIERTRVLLSRAPADRAWRRRGWLVMLRARKAGQGKRWAGSNDDAAGEEGGSEKKKNENTQSGGGQGRATVDEEGLNASISEVVVWLLGLEQEGIFRTVVGFM